MRTLQDMLPRVGLAAVPVDLPEGGRLLLLPEYGRVLGLYAPQCDLNFFWTNPVLEDVDRARQHFAEKAWHNPGGDRTWLAPERDLFISDLSRPFETYRVPSAIDPGMWQLALTENGATMTCSGEIRLHQSHDAIRFNLSKRIAPAFNPLRHTSLEHADICYAGYSMTVNIEAARSADATRSVEVGIWNLLQLPAPGRMLVATHSRSQPRLLFGDPAAPQLQVDKHLVQWHVAHGSRNTKIGLKAASLTGRAGYMYRHAGTDLYQLVIRRFNVNPSGAYVDTPWLDPEDRGYAFQGCQVCGAGLARFCELEHHAPVVATASGRCHGVDESQVWAFRGNQMGISSVAGMLLGLG